MNDNSIPRISKTPFMIGDALLLCVAAWFSWQQGLSGWTMAGLIFAAVAMGAWLAVTPFILQFKAEMKFAETAQLTSATEQLGNLPAISEQIANASREWQHVHQSTTQTVTAADQIAEKMTAEARNFGEILTRINEVEKSHLRLEVEKLRRAEADWLQVLVRTFDHIYALHRAGVESGQRNVVEQLTHFQNACRDVARRIGFVAIMPQPGAAFDEKQHQVLEGQQKKEGAEIVGVVAPGYTFQGQLLRLPVVALRDENEPKPQEPEAQLSLDDARQT